MKKHYRIVSAHNGLNGELVTGALTEEQMIALCDGLEGRMAAHGIQLDRVIVTPIAESEAYEKGVISFCPRCGSKLSEGFYSNSELSVVCDGCGACSSITINCGTPGMHLSN